MNLSIVICTHNRAQLLGETLASLNRATRPAGYTVEIVVVANGCTDGTADAMRAYAARQAHDNLLPLRFIDEPRLGKSYALNTALAADLAPMVAFVDDDQTADAGYLEGIRRAGEQFPETQLFCGKIWPDWTGKEPAWIYDEGPYRVFPTPVPKFDLGDEPKLIEPDTVTPSGGNIFVRSALFPQVGPFSVDLGPTGHNLLGGEDVEWIKRALGTGATLRYVPWVHQYHYVDPERITMAYMLRKAFERSCSVVLFSPQHQAVRRVPFYLVRKLLGHVVTAAFSLNGQKRRHFLLRIAATLGELKGFRKLAQDNRARRAES